MKNGILICCAALVGGCGQDDTAFAHSAARQAAVDQADVGLLLNELAALAAWHADVDSGLSLRPGLSQDVRSQVSQAFGCEPSDELIAMWQWRDGEAGDQFFWYHQFMSLDEAVSAQTILSWTPFIGWQDNWIPFAQFEGEWMFVECSDVPRRGLPVGRFLLESGADFGYDNLTRYLQTLNASIDAGALSWQDGWWLEAEPRQLGDIHRQINEHGAFPYAEPSGSNAD